MNWKDIDAIVMDFDGVFTDNAVLLNEDGRESVLCSRSDGLAFDILRKFCKLNSWDLTYFVLSKEKNPVVLTRCNKLSIECIHGVDNKLQYLNQRLDSMVNQSGTFERVLYLGNDLNDYLPMEKVEFSAAPSDAHPLIKSIATSVYSAPGGHGFVRLVIEELLQLSSMGQEDLRLLL